MKSGNSVAMRLSASKHLPYGAVIIFMCSTSLFFSSPGQTYFLSVFIEHYITDLGWSRSLISTLYSFATLLSGSLLFYVGKLADKYSSRRMTLIVAIVLGATSFFSSFIISPWMLFAAFFLGRISGQGALALLPSTILPKWFIRRRALAFSLMALGEFVGSALLPPVNSILIENFGWRFTWRLWALIIWLIFIPLVWLFLYDRPEELNLLQDFKKPGNQKTNPPAQITLQEHEPVDSQQIQVESHQIDEAQSQIEESQSQIDSGYTLAEAMKGFSFWGIIYIQALIPLIVTGLIFHFLSIMSMRGVAQTESPFLISIIALVSLPSTIMAGALFSKIKITTGASMFTLLLAIGLSLLVFTNGIALSIAFVVILGITQGLQGVWTGIVWPDYYGTKHLGSIRGFAMTTMVLASSIGPIIFGVIYDVTGSYVYVLAITLIMTLIGFIISFFVRQPAAAVS